MNIHLHASAATTPKIRQYIQASYQSVPQLAAELSVGGILYFLQFLSFSILLTTKLSGVRCERPSARTPCWVAPCALSCRLPSLLLVPAPT